MTDGHFSRPSSSARSISFSCLSLWSPSRVDGDRKRRVSASVKSAPQSARHGRFWKGGWALAARTSQNGEETDTYKPALTETFSRVGDRTLATEEAAGGALNWEDGSAGHTKEEEIKKTYPC
jgi:hypothetical protein